MASAPLFWENPANTYFPNTGLELCGAIRSATVFALRPTLITSDAHSRPLHRFAVPLPRKRGRKRVRLTQFHISGIIEIWIRKTPSNGFPRSRRMRASKFSACW
jgi:hypothetical protein